MSVQFIRTAGAYIAQINAFDGYLPAGYMVLFVMHDNVNCQKCFEYKRGEKKQADFIFHVI